MKFSFSLWCMLFGGVFFGSGHAVLSDHFKKPTNKNDAVHAMGGIDFIYVINLDERPEKFQEVQKELSPFGIFPYRFSAVNGWKLPIDVIEDVGVKIFKNSLRLDRPATRYEFVNGEFKGIDDMMPISGKTYFCHCFSRGAIAICLSHLSVLQDAYDSGYNTIWIMEDDIKVVKDPRILTSVIQKLDQVAPEWDILFTDRDTKNQKNEEVPCAAIILRPNFFVNNAFYFLKKNKNINADFAYTGMRYGAYSWIVRRKGMKKILDYFKTYKIFSPFDADFAYVPGICMVKVREEIVSTNPKALSDNGGPNYLNKPKELAPQFGK